MIRKGIPYYGRLFLGLRKPKHPIPGTGFAGTIEAIGPAVQNFQIGDRVFGETSLGFGANAEYICIDEGGILTTMPSNLSYEAAAPICDGALTGINFLKQLGNIQKGQKSIDQWCLW